MAGMVFGMVWERAKVVQKRNLYNKQLLSNGLFLSSKHVKDVLIIYSLLNKSLNSSSLSQSVLPDRSEREGPFRSSWQRNTKRDYFVLCDSLMSVLSLVLLKHALMLHIYWLRNTFWVQTPSAELEEKFPPDCIPAVYFKQDVYYTLDINPLSSC